MIFNTTGGGTALNFKVVGNPQPSTAKENTIWIDTDTITSWLFSATEPSPAEPGMVWISIGTSSTVEFNALKKNGIQVYPLSAKQYVSGAWVDKTAKSYHGGEWVEWVTFLYKDGNQYNDITGGWKCSRGDKDQATCNFNDKNIFFSTTFVAGSHAAGGGLCTTKKIDLTNVKTIRAVLSEASCSNNLPLYLYADPSIIGSVTDSAMPAAYKKLSTVSTRTEFTLEVTSLPGEHLVGIASHWGSSNGTSSFTMTEFYIE